MSKSTRYYKATDNPKLIGKAKIARCAYQTGLKKSDALKKKA